MSGTERVTVASFAERYVSVELVIRDGDGKEARVLMPRVKDFLFTASADHNELDLREVLRDPPLLSSNQRVEMTGLAVEPITIRHS